MAWISFGDLHCRKNNLTSARVSMLLKSRTSLTCFRAYFLPGRAKDLSALRYWQTTLSFLTLVICSTDVWWWNFCIPSTKYAYHFYTISLLSCFCNTAPPSIFGTKYYSSWPSIFGSKYYSSWPHLNLTQRHWRSRHSTPTCGQRHLTSSLKATTTSLSVC